MKVLLLSGGLDSSALACLERPDMCLTIDYGQRSARGEVRAATVIAGRLGIPSASFRIDCSALGSGDLSGRESHPAAPSTDWWPYRNQLLVTLSAAWALPRQVSTIVVGSVANDRFHVDGTTGFYSRLDELLRMQEGNLTVEVPAINRETSELVRRSGLSLSLAAWTHSCHVANLACGACRGCTKRLGVFRELGWEP